MIDKITCKLSRFQFLSDMLISGGLLGADEGICTPLLIPPSISFKISVKVYTA
jgi:hypothetical protein